MTKHSGTGNLKRSHTRADPGQPMAYQIRIEGHLDDQWTYWFSGMAIALEDDGNTLLTGSISDQVALFGLLKRIRDLGIPLVSLNRVEPGEPDVSSASLEKEKRNERRGGNAYPNP